MIAKNRRGRIRNRQHLTKEPRPVCARRRRSGREHGIDNQTSISQSLQISRQAFHTRGPAFTATNKGDAPVPQSDEMLHRLGRRRQIVRRNHVADHPIQPARHLDNGHAALQHCVDGRGPGAIGGAEQNAIDPVFHQGAQLPFLSSRIVTGIDQEGHEAVLIQHIFNTGREGSKKWVRNIGDYQANRVGLTRPQLRCSAIIAISNPRRGFQNTLARGRGYPRPPLERKTHRSRGYLRLASDVCKDHQVSS